MGNRQYWYSKSISFLLVTLFAGCNLVHADVFSPPSPFKKTGTNVTLVTPTNNVGIGSATPQSALVVAGTVTATAFSGSGAIPQGMIVMWSGTIATIPTGWELSDGTCSITCPDLRNRFIVAADADDAGAAKSTITGSAAQSGGSTTITSSNMPAHTHTLSPTTRQSAGGDGPNFGTSANGGSSYDVSPTGSTGGGTAYTQPFYALAYVIKI